MSWEDSLGNMAALDRWRAAIDLVYDLEQPGAVATASGRPLAVRTPHPLPTARIEGLDKPVSRLVLGVDNQRTAPHAAVMFDEFFERGGTCFDTAYVYLGGLSERLLGRWIASRGVREQVVVLNKGAHTPYCTPDYLSKQLLESLERLDAGYVDIYMMHGDNLDVPVGEFIDVLDEHQRAGRLRLFGASNWTPDRLDAAQHYARLRGVSGFSAISNNISLAEMVAAPWAGSLRRQTRTLCGGSSRLACPSFRGLARREAFLCGSARQEIQRIPNWRAAGSVRRTFAAWSALSTLLGSAAYCRSTSPWRMCSASLSRPSP